MIYVPVWKRPPNRFIRYEDRPFALPENAHGIIKLGIETVAVFRDKNGKEQEMQAFIKWEEK